LGQAFWAHGIRNYSIRLMSLPSLHVQRAAMIRACCLAALAAAASGLKQARRSNHSVFFLGSSVDRMAVENFCGKEDKFYRVGCRNEKRELAIGFWFHPGVGINGDLQPPFYNRTRFPDVQNIIRDKTLLQKNCRAIMGDIFPDMVVVDSLLWDMATWASWGLKNVTEERVRKWGDHDLHLLLTRVSEAFPTSRVVFRTAPTVHHPKFLNEPELRNLNIAVISAEGVNMMNSELGRHMTEGKLYGQYQMVDYSGIMNELLEERGFADPSLWLKDGYHPSREPSRRYMNEVLRLMDMTTVEEEDWGKEKTRRGVAPNDDSDDVGEFP